MASLSPGGLENHVPGRSARCFLCPVNARARFAPSKKWLIRYWPKAEADIRENAPNVAFEGKADMAISSRNVRP